MTAGDIGTVITCNLGGYVASQSATVSLIVQRVANPAPQHASYVATIGASGLTASYTTTGVEFPIGGTYNVAINVAGAQYSYTSPPVLVKVANAITP